MVSIVGVYHVGEVERPMAMYAKVFMSGRSQAVRLPKELRFEADRVVARRFGNGVLLLPVEAPWQVMREALEEFDDGFGIEREQPPAQERKGWSDD